MSEPIVRMEHACKSFGGVQAVKDVSISIGGGGVVGLVGPNGAGKSTLFDLMTGVQRLDSGRRIVAGRDMTREPGHTIAAAGIARTFQKVRLFPSLSVLDNVVVGGLAFHKKVYRSRDAGREALERVGLANQATRWPAELTLIDRKRVELARALVSSPSLLLLDEVMTGLTPQEVEGAIRLIRQLVGDGITVVLVEHLLKVVMRVSDRVLVLNEGEVIADDSPHSIQRDAAVIEAYIGTGEASPHDAD